MAYYDAKGTLAEAVANDDAQQLLLPVPTDGRDYELVYRIAGTFVGTVQAQDDQGGSFAGIATVPLGETGTVSAADPTGVGNFHGAVVSGAGYARIVFSVYTSGEADIEAVLIPTSA